MGKINNMYSEDSQSQIKRKNVMAGKDMFTGINEADKFDARKSSNYRNLSNADSILKKKMEDLEDAMDSLHRLSNMAKTPGNFDDQEDFDMSCSSVWDSLLDALNDMQKELKKNEF